MALKVWLPLDGNNRNLGVNSYITSWNPDSYVNDGKLGMCGNIPTTAGNINTGIPYTEWNYPNNSVSFGAWFKFNKADIEAAIEGLSYDSNNRTVKCGLLGFDSYGGFGLRWRTNDIYAEGSFSKSCVYVALRSSANRANVSYATDAYVVPFDTWTHIFVVLDRETATFSLYINGVLNKIADFDTSKINNETMDDRMTTFRVCGTDFDGGVARVRPVPFKINDLRIYDEALSEKQIKEIAKGLVAHYKLEGVGARENLLSESKLSVGTLANKTTETLFGLPVYRGVYTSGTYLDTYNINSFIAPTGDTYYTGSFWAKGTGAMTCYFYPNTVTSGINSQGRTTTSADGNITFTLTNGWQKYWVTWKTSSSISGNKNLIFGRITSGEVYISNPKLELGQEVSNWIPNINDKLYTDLGYDKMILKDSSGYGHDLTPKNNTGVLSKDTIRYQCSLLNNNDYFYNNSFNIIGNYTFSVWFKITTWRDGSGANAIYIYHLGYGFSNIQSSVWINSNSIKLISNNTQYNPSYSFSLNTWYHLVTTQDSSTAKIYINGTLLGSTSVSSTSIVCSLLTVMNRSANSTVGSDGGYIANGNISDLRIYCTALSDADVKELYQTSALIDNKNNMLAYEFIEE